MDSARNLSEAPAPPPAVLVVEDDVLVRTVAAYLRDCGYEVVEAGNADEAILVLQSDIRVDIVFSDINMPGSELDGFGLAHRVRRERPALKIILTSGAVRTAKEAGDLCEHGPILAKPCDHADLERKIRALLAR